MATSDDGRWCMLLKVDDGGGSEWCWSEKMVETQFSGKLN